MLVRIVGEGAHIPIRCFGKGRHSTSNVEMMSAYMHTILRDTNAFLGFGILTTKKRYREKNSSTLLPVPIRTTMPLTTSTTSWLSPGTRLMIPRLGRLEA